MTARPYWRVCPAFWGDEKVVGWDDATRLLALYLLTCEHRTTEGLFRLPRGYILADMGWSEEQLRNPFETLSKEGFIEYDERVAVVFIRHALEYQPPENPNQVTGIVRRLENLPETPLLTRLFEVATETCPALATAMDKAFRNRFERVRQTVSKPTAITTAITKAITKNTDMSTFASEVDRVSAENSFHKGREHPHSAASIRAKPKRTDGEEAFLYWVQVMGKPDHALYEGKRRAACERRLKRDSTLEEIKLAILGCSQTGHNMGDNDRGKLYNDLELICRDRTDVERFMETARARNGPRLDELSERRIQAAVGLYRSDPAAAQEQIADDDLWLEVVRRASAS